jgi:hypothetical protein
VPETGLATRLYLNNNWEAFAVKNAARTRRLRAGGWGRRAAPAAEAALRWTAPGRTDVVGEHLEEQAHH